MIWRNRTPNVVLLGIQNGAAGVTSKASDPNPKFFLPLYRLKWTISVPLKLPSQKTCVNPHLS